MDVRDSVVFDKNRVNATMSLKYNDPIFSNLYQIKDSLSPKNQTLIPTLIKAFGDLYSNILKGFDLKLNEAVSRIESKFTEIIQLKDTEIEELKATNAGLQEQVINLDEKLDALNAHSRKDTIIVSGALPQPVPNEVSHTVVRELLAQKFPTVTINDNDISVAHRLQKKRANDGSIPPPNFLVKLVRRNLKIELIQASRKQSRDAHDKVFINESLTPQRSAVLQTLLKLKKEHKAVKGVTSMQGEVYAYMEHPAVAGGSTAGGSHRDTRHTINTQTQLKKFCREHLKKSLEEFIDSS